MRRILFPLIFGIAGFAVLVGLGSWQVGRLTRKQDILERIDTLLLSEPVALPDAPIETIDEYRPVHIRGVATEEELHVLVSGTVAGTGYRVISGFQTDAGRRLLLDQGFLPLGKKTAVPVIEPIEVTGTLLWPDDLNSSTPPPDLVKNIWYARDLTAMALALDTEPFLVVVRTAEPADARLTPLPVDSANIRNNHLEYIITWFSLALIWAAMTAYFLWRTRAKAES